MDGENTEMESVILENLFNIQIPKLYVKAIEEDNFYGCDTIIKL